MKRLFHVIPAAVLLAAGSTVALSAELSAGSKALVAANAAMHKAMAVEMTGDVDVDFMRTMVPHHQGAVEMAKIVVDNGKDPEVRKLAEEIYQSAGGRDRDHGGLAAKKWCGCCGRCVQHRSRRTLRSTLQIQKTKAPCSQGAFRCTGRDVSFSSCDYP